MGPLLNKRVIAAVLLWLIIRNQSEATTASPKVSSGFKFLPLDPRQESRCLLAGGKRHFLESTDFFKILTSTRRKNFSFTFSILDNYR